MLCFPRPQTAQWHNGLVWPNNVLKHFMLLFPFFIICHHPSGWASTGKNSERPFPFMFESLARWTWHRRGGLLNFSRIQAPAAGQIARPHAWVCHTEGSWYRGVALAEQAVCFWLDPSKTTWVMIQFVHPFIQRRRCSCFHVLPGLMSSRDQLNYCETENAVAKKTFCHWCIEFRDTLISDFKDIIVCFKPFIWWLVAYTHKCLSAV